MALFASMVLGLVLAAAHPKRAPREPFWFERDDHLVYREGPPKISTETQDCVCFRDERPAALPVVQLKYHSMDNNLSGFCFSICGPGYQPRIVRQGKV
jgi:hypothetical protein